MLFACKYLILSPKKQFIRCFYEFCVFLELFTIWYNWQISTGNAGAGCFADTFAYVVNVTFDYIRYLYVKSEMSKFKMDKSVASNSAKCKRKSGQGSCC